MLHEFVRSRGAWIALFDIVGDEHSKKVGSLFDTNPWQLLCLNSIYSAMKTSTYLFYVFHCRHRPSSRFWLSAQVVLAPYRVTK